MKKRLSLVVLAVLVIAACLTVFAACNNNNVDAYMLLTLKETLDDTKIGPVTNADFQVPATVSAIDIDENEITVDVVWTVESGGSAVTVGEKSQDGKTVTIKVTRGSSEVVYMLKGKLADAKGNAYKDENGAELVSSFGCRVEASGNQGGSDVEGATATISVIGTSTMTVKTAAQNVFEQNGVKITNDKASSTNNCIAVSNEAYASRFYAGSTIKIEYANMTKIVITLDDGNYNGKTYVAGFDGMDVSGATITRDGATVTIVFDSPVSVFQTTGLASQVRIYSFAIFC